MLTDKCKMIIDEAIAANGNYEKLSLEASAHLETCIECRRSLESIKALKASTQSVIPAASLALKSKIAANLKEAMQARHAAAASSGAAKSSLTTASIIVGVGLAGSLALGVLALGNNSLSSTPKPNLTETRSTNNSNSLSTNASESVDLKSDLSKENASNTKKKILSNDISNEDMRSNEPINYPTQNIPSSKVDSNL
jgi:hypothetical protein